MEQLEIPTFIETIDEFEIYFTPLVEYNTIEGSMDDELAKDTIERVESGELVWFCAKVTAWKAGVELGEEYLGSCCYESFKDFYTTYKEDYYADMRDRAISQGKAKIKRLLNDPSQSALSAIKDNLNG